jgi:hypothetical protein
MAKVFLERESLQRETLSSDLLKCQPNYKFIFAHSMESWEFVEGPDGEGEWLPRLKRLSLNPGANGIKGTRKTPDWRFFRLYLEGQGWTIVSPEVETVTWDGEEFIEADDGYLFSTGCTWSASGQTFTGKRYLDPWDRPVDGIRGADFRSHRDRIGFAEWRRRLVESGAIKPPSPAVINAEIRRQRTRADRNLSAYAGNTHVASRVDAARKRYDKMKAASEEMLDAPVRPTHRRRKRPVPAGVRVENIDEPGDVDDDE